MYKEIDLSNAKLVGKGAHCEVFKLGEDRVLKLYFDFVPEEEILREQKLARFSVDSGLRTANVYDIYSYNGRLGLMFEYINSVTLTEYLVDHPDEIEYFAKKFANTAKDIHKINVDNSICNNYKDTLRKRADNVKAFYKQKELDKLERLITAVPEADTCLHTDFHPGNVMVDGKELILIDMADISYGHPIFDLASSYMSLVMIPAHIDKVGNRQTASLSKENFKKFWDIFIREYLQDDDTRKIKLYEECCKGITGLRVCAAKRIGNEDGNGVEIGRRVAKLSRFTFFPKVNKYIRVMSKL